MDDITQRLRMSKDPSSVDRERYMAGELFGNAMRDMDGRVVGEGEVARIAKQSIRAACVFWQEWEIACLTYNDEPEDTVYGYCVGEMR